MNKPKHRWTERDTTIGYYLFRFGDAKLPMSKEDIGEKLGMGSGSMISKIGNFKALDGQGGFDHYTRQDERVYNKYRDLPDSEFEMVALQAITEAYQDWQKAQGK